MADIAFDFLYELQNKLLRAKPRLLLNVACTLLLFFSFSLLLILFQSRLSQMWDFSARLFTVINSSINFFIYSISGSDFRDGMGSFMGSSESSQAPQQSMSVQRVSCSVPRRMSVSSTSVWKGSSVRHAQLYSDSIHTSIAYLCSQIRNSEINHKKNVDVDLSMDACSYDNILRSETYLTLNNPNWV